MTQYNTIAIIVAAGNGHRLGGNIPKQYLQICGKTVLCHSVEAFLYHPEIDAVCVVYNPQFHELYSNSVGHLPLLPPVTGGNTRHESVKLGLESIEKYSPKKVLIHDAARPLVDKKIIADIVNKLENVKAVIPGIPLEDTIKNCKNNKIINTIPRDNLIRAQTPQGFVFKEVFEAYRLSAIPTPSSLLERFIIKMRSILQKSSLKFTKKKMDGVFTDDASLFEESGKEITIIPGSQNNFKITTKEDLKRAEMIMGNMFEMRVGNGFDAHKFCAPKSLHNNYIMLCGIKVPHEFSLEGHSDADVGLHAAVDAILGAIALGDIGTYFPPNDSQWKDADSSIFLDYTAKLLRDSGANIINIDITLICERPKILPHRTKMREIIAKILGIEDYRVSIKATTTEGMGFTGRSEGIAAQAVVSLRVLSAGF